MILLNYVIIFNIREELVPFFRNEEWNDFMVK